MTNTQQTVVGQVTGVEQSQEEVQLTELLPVEQYRIQESADYTDSGATDALKALRSFSQANEQEFNSQEFNFYDQYDELETLNGCEDFHKKRRSQWNNSEDDELNLDNKSIKDEGVDTNDFVTKDSSDKEYADQKEIKIKGKGKSIVNGKRKLRTDKREAKRRTKQIKEKEGDDVIDELSDDSNFLDEEAIEDEIYAFQHDSEGESLSIVDTKLEVMKNQTNSVNARSSKKDLRKKIDAIIQANILLEQENNNVMQEDSSEKGNNSLGKQPKKYICIICNAKFKGSGGLRNHYKVAHATGPIYKCDECGKEFPLKERLKLHVRTHTGFKPYKCLECDKSFARGGQLVQHRRTHSQVKPYHCSLCSGTFTCAANLALHMKRHNGQKDHKCEICGRGFVRRDALKKHMECLHHDVKSFLCGICNKTLKGHLPQHMRTHAQDRPHGCGTCGQRFAQKSQLTVHQRTHSGQRPFRCLVCWQAFAHSTALKLHTRRHTGERPFKCEECNAGFTQLPHWKKHMKCIHGRNEPYCCKRCKSFFRIKCELETHQKFCKLSSRMNSNEDDQVEVFSNRVKYRVMPIEKMRLLLAVLLKRISKPEKLDELGFGKRLIDEVLHDSLISAGKEPVKRENTSEFDCLKKNVEIFLEWTVPKSHWAKFKKMKKTPEEILETLTTSAND